jgi:hypothetical protein
VRAARHGGAAVAAPGAQRVHGSAARVLARLRGAAGGAAPARGGERAPRPYGAPCLRLDAWLARGDGRAVADRLPGCGGAMAGHAARAAALAAAAVLAGVSRGALLRGGRRPLEVRGLGGGVLSAASTTAVRRALRGRTTAGSAGWLPLRPVRRLGDYGDGPGGFGRVGAGADEVFYDGAMDAGALVAPGRRGSAGVGRRRAGGRGARRALARGVVGRDGAWSDTNGASVRGAPPAGQARPRRSAAAQRPRRRREGSRG